MGKFNLRSVSSYLFSRLYFLIYILLVFFLFASLIQLCSCDCSISEHTDDPQTKNKEKTLLERIKPLKGKEFTDKDGNYTYKIRICDKIKGQKDNAGAVQVNGDQVTSLGMIDSVDIMGGKNWILLSYLNGTAYHATHCKASPRMAQIIIICDKDSTDFRALWEKRKKESFYCAYWFELSDPVACTEEHVSNKMSSGGVFCIIFFTFVGVYLVGGFLYKRLVVGSKGLEQIPNYTFWRWFGNLQADACDYVCRCGPRHETQAYRGIDDRLKTEEHDDQLLNM